MAPFTMMDIKLLCGVTAFIRGEAYNQSGRVSNLVVSDNQRHYEAMVRGTERYQVKVDLDEKGEVEATCTCPGDGRYYDYCKHVAAVLLAIHEWGEQQELKAAGTGISQESSKPSSGNSSSSGIGSGSRVGTLVEEKEWERPNSSSTLDSARNDNLERHEGSDSKRYTESSTSTTSHSFAQRMGLRLSGLIPLLMWIINRLPILPRQAAQVQPQAGDVQQTSLRIAQPTRFCPSLPRNAVPYMPVNVNLQHLSPAHRCGKSFRFSLYASSFRFTKGGQARTGA